MWVCVIGIAGMLLQNGNFLYSKFKFVYDSNKNYKGMQTGRLWQMRGEICPTYNATQNKKFAVKEIVIKSDKICCVSLRDRSYLFAYFLCFLRFLEWQLHPKSMQVLKKSLQFSCSHF
jgi:hypothetical protein